MKYHIKEWIGGSFEVECDIEELKPICETKEKVYAELVCDALNDYETNHPDNLFVRISE